MVAKAYTIGVKYSESQNNSRENVTKIGELAHKNQSICIGQPIMTSYGNREWSFTPDNKKGALEFLSEILELECVEGAKIITR